VKICCPRGCLPMIACQAGRPGRLPGTRYLVLFLSPTGCVVMIGHDCGGKCVSEPDAAFRTPLVPGGRNEPAGKGVSLSCWGRRGRPCDPLIRHSGRQSERRDNQRPRPQLPRVHTKGQTCRCRYPHKARSATGLPVPRRNILGSTTGQRSDTLRPRREGLQPAPATRPDARPPDCTGR